MVLAGWMAGRREAGMPGDSLRTGALGAQEVLGHPFTEQVHRYCMIARIFYADMAMGMAAWLTWSLPSPTLDTPRVAQ